MKSTKTDDPREAKQTNLAEGREVVDQSIQAHERKGDLKNSGELKASNQNKKRG